MITVSNVTPHYRQGRGPWRRYRTRADWYLGVAAQSIERHGFLLPCHLPGLARIRNAHQRRIAAALVSLFAL